jgi:2-octaprenyl-6-methoxyphenol hydroxylase
MNHSDTDTGTASRIVIAGGGMAGLSLALLLDRQLPPDVAISLVEGVALPPAAQTTGTYHPSFDARSTALSYSTATIYRELGIWEQLQPGLAPIESIHVSRRGRFGSALLQAREQGWEALGWVVENPCLGRSLLAAVRERPRIELLCPARVTGATPAAGGVTVDCAGEAPTTLHADLLVIADGADSTLRDGLGFFTRRKVYGQQALIANLAFPEPLRACAWERFTASGPLALLPLPPGDHAPHRAALVWTLPPQRAELLLGADEADFSAALVDAFGYRLGRPLRVGQRHAYPLVLTEAIEQQRRGMVVLGNAAHALHPVAGQGFNLALRDAASLATALAAAPGGALGDPALLDEYQRLRARDQAQTILASDGLPGLFTIADPLLALARDLALSGLDLLPAARSFFVNQAAGMAALEAANG